MTAPRACFEELADWVEGTQACGLTHGELEAELDGRGRELLRQLFQAQLELRALREQRVAEVADADGVAHGSVEAGHTRPLTTIFGAVEVGRLAYRHRRRANLHPADGQLNLPVERHSHGLRRLAAIEAPRGSFEQAGAAIGRSTGQPIGKRQVEELTKRAAVDVADFYATRAHTPAEGGDVLVLSADGKGIVMRPESLRPATAAKAAVASTKLATRLSKGEKRNRKRMAEVGAVYDLTPVPRAATDVITGHGGDGRGGEDCHPRGSTTPADTPPADTPPADRPRAKNKWLTASVVEDAADVIADVFAEADHRDPGHQRSWVALVDGNSHQIERITAEATARDVPITIIIDLIHVLEYVWGAAWCFFAEGDRAAEAWVHDRALAILEGNARQVAAGIRRRASTAGLAKAKRAKADTCARYLINKAEYLDYPTALASGWPIATGIIEGACRHLVADRMDITGARWSAPGAEAVLKLRAIQANDDFEPYWRFHLDREHERVHAARYHDGVIPAAA